MSVSSALGPVSVAVYAALSVAGVTALVGTRIYDDVPQGVSFPFVLYEVQETFSGGLGTKPGDTRGMWDIDLRVHVFSTYAGFKEAQAILAACVTALVSPVAVTGLTMHAIFHDAAVPLGDEIINGVKCKELVQLGRIYVEAT